jgi:predicted phage tail protein
LNTIFLHGDLAEKFGDEHRLAVSTPREAVKALCVIKKGFREAFEDGEYKVIRKSQKTGDGLVLDEVTIFLGMSDTDLHIIPMPAGSKKAGVGKILLGVAFIGAAILTAGGTAALGAGLGAFAGGAGLTMSVGLSLFGASLVLGGVASMMMPTPGAPNPNAAEDKEQSFLFNGAVNVQAQGHPVPLAYGRVLTGSVVVSSGISIQQIGTYRGGAGVDTSDANYAGGYFPTYPVSINGLP